MSTKSDVVKNTTEPLFDPNKKHPSHKTRPAMGASSYDEKCIYCGATDQVPGGWGELAKPCSNPNGPEKY